MQLMRESPAANVDTTDVIHFDDLFRDPAYPQDHPLSFVLGQKQLAIDALRGLFSGGHALVKLRLWCFLELAAQSRSRLSREDVNQLFHAVLPDPLDAVLKRLRELGLLVWDATAQDYHLSPLAHPTQALLAPLAKSPQDDDELSGLLAQVAGSQQLGVLDASQLQHLHAQLARLHDDFAEAIASGSEARLRQAQPRFDRALSLVEKAGQALSAIIQDHNDSPRLERAARALGQDQARLLSMASQFTRALQQADRLRVTLGSTGLTSSDVRHWLQHHPDLSGLLGDSLSTGVRPVFVSQHDLLDVAEGEFDRDRPDPQRSSGLPPPAQADTGSLDILSLPPELGQLIDLFGRWDNTPLGEAAGTTGEHALSEAVLGGRFAHAAYRLQLMPLLGDAQAQTLKSPTGELARTPWRMTLTPALVPVQGDAEVSLISEGRLSCPAPAAPPLSTGSAPE
jgi:hypothetical protein